MHDVKISKKEWLKISRSLEMHHAVFYKLWEMGKPVFTDKIKTAAVMWDKKGDFIAFLFNPKFWLSLNEYNRRFVIAHECLHIILNHGIRTIDAFDRDASNEALDIVVNHGLVRDFGFDRSAIKDWEKLCWVDTVFKGRPVLPKDDESYEHYINLFEKVYGKGKGKGNGLLTVDDHRGLAGELNENEEDLQDWGEVIDSLNKGLSEEEKEQLEDIVNKHFQHESSSDKFAPSKAGSGGGSWTFVKKQKVIKKKKWETVIKKWSKRYYKPDDREVEQWARINRRFVMMSNNDLFLPSEMEVEEEKAEATQIKVFFFLDTSGSCYGLKDRFFQAAESLPPERFDVRLFCFDTAVQETSLESRMIYGGGGTRFDILEQEIQKEDSYPEAVFVLTDGWGTPIKPQIPERWYWFLTDLSQYTMRMIKSYIPNECNFFNLKDYE